MSWLSNAWDSITGQTSTAPAGKTADQIAADARKKQIKDTTLRIIEQARKADRMRGAGGLQFNGVTGDPNFGSNVQQQNPVGLFGGADRMLLGR